MNTRQLEIQAKALAPVIRGFVEKAVNALKTELQQWVKDSLTAHESRLTSTIEAVKNSIPPQPAEPLDKAAINALIAEQVGVAVEQSRTATDEALAALGDEYFGNLAEYKDAIDTRLEAVKNSIPPQPAEPLDKAAINALIAEQVDVAVEQSRTATDEALAALGDEYFGNLAEYKDAIDTRLAALSLQLHTLNDGEKIDAERVKALFAELFAEEKANFPAPKDGPPGADGINGQDGKDALQLEVLPAIDFEKTYPRNTYALHNGGLLRAYQQTLGEKGWETVLNGVADVQIEQKNAREFTIRALQTNGKVSETRFSVPVMVYRNIYKDAPDDGPYQQGDVVTFSGSLWHADQDNPPGKPGTGDSGWTLAAKKGRDGKNGDAR